MIMDTDSTQIGGKRARKLSMGDAEAIASLVATRKLLENEACLSLGIQYKQWLQWKSRHKHGATFESLITRMKADKLAGLLDNIENVSNGIGVKQRDWRAGAWIAERLAPERFALNQAPAINQTANVTVIAMHDTLKRLFQSPIESLQPVCELASVTTADEGLKQLKSNLAQSIKLPTRRRI